MVQYAQRGDASALLIASSSVGRASSTSAVLHCPSSEAKMRPGLRFELRTHRNTPRQSHAASIVLSGSGGGGGSNKSLSLPMGALPSLHLQPKLRTQHAHGLGPPLLLLASLTTSTGSQLSQASVQASISTRSSSNNNNNNSSSSSSSRGSGSGSSGMQKGVGMWTSTSNPTPTASSSLSSSPGTSNSISNSSNSRGGNSRNSSGSNSSSCGGDISSANTSAISEHSSMFGGLRYLKLLFSGAMSAVVARTVVAPLERVKMELMLKHDTGGARATARQILRTEGIPGFWKGHLLNLLRTAPFKAINFMCWDCYHPLFVSLTKNDGNFERFVAGAMAGISATTVCFPLDVLRTRYLAKGGSGKALSTLYRIISVEGVGALYSGVLPAVIAMAPAGAVFYGVYDLLKHQHLSYLEEKFPLPDGKHHTALQNRYTLLFGAMAGAASEMVVYPLEVIRRHIQLHSMAQANGGRAMKGLRMLNIKIAPGNTSSWSRVVATCTSIHAQYGMRGFYIGLWPNMLQVLPSAALSYWTYDTCKALLGIV